MKKRPKIIKVHPAFGEMLHLEAAIHGKSMVKYTEKIATDKGQIKDMVDEWKEKHGGRIKKRSFLDFP